MLRYYNAQAPFNKRRVSLTEDEDTRARSKKRRVISKGDEGNQDELQTQIQTQNTRQDNNQQSYHQPQQVQQKHQIPITSSRQEELFRTYFDMIATKLPISKLFQLGISLHLTYNEINEIVSSTKIDSDYEKKYRVLELWKQKKGQDADHKEVISALRKVGVNDIADQIELILKE
ncbi:uncharacterized protein TRIADDRAFT_62070 [Trichoplax adhaerens]|uniref:Death domain-containing protein n=1 Tax=Trichoplax adhaerens TaxID=10228 RepID=B3SCR5_TRIAD|nr:hypothetical protein TRIADDRAFT_62070 [Trichoplax adhaerens]EDV19517.1 hypothetical protein TRIADDRAFT_62070 [Trichoplax adhaerens]|eukprot:XP_002118034.1 hypothetical protein TRIADDRAFT_62070 [Trichoplax adhaerens]